MSQYPQLTPSAGREGTASTEAGKEDDQDSRVGGRRHRVHSAGYVIATNKKPQSVSHSVNGSLCLHGHAGRTNLNATSQAPRQYRPQRARGRQLLVPGGGVRLGHGRRGRSYRSHCWLCCLGVTQVVAVRAGPRGALSRRAGRRRAAAVGSWQLECRARCVLVPRDGRATRRATRLWRSSKLGGGRARRVRRCRGQSL